MKKIIATLSMLFTCIFINAQVNTQNHVHTRTFTNTAGTTSLDVIQYFDGLGRPIQTIQKKVTPGETDLATYQQYDSAGRPSNSWLPVSTGGSGGAFTQLSTFKTYSTNTYADAKAYSLSIYETSPLNRILEQYDPGQEWHNNNKKVLIEYLSNNSTYPCRLYQTTNSRSGIEISTTGNYADGQLSITKTSDEDGNNITYEFKNKIGQVVLTRQINGTVPYDTYYIYDSFGNLRAVLPPLASDNLTAINTNWTNDTKALADYAYLYKYDIYNRMIGKKLPGAGWITYSYDKGDRVIFSQDGEQAAKTPKEWTFYLYDRQGRQVVQGTCTNSNTAVSNILVTVDGTYPLGTGVGGSGYISNFEITSPVVHLSNYYDYYSFRNWTGFNNANFPQETVPARGLLTATVTTILDSSTKLYSAYYYDAEGRIINTVSSNHMGGYDKITTTYTFTGKPKTVTQAHTAAGKTTQTQVYTYTYDHAERLKSLTHKLNTGAVTTLINNTYDNLGRLQNNSRNGVTSLADNYAYNVRSWVTKISGTQFTENLTYKYNGNIATMQWLTNGQTRKYTYTYDPLSRIKTAAYTGATTAEKYNTSYTYDKHGNIKTLERYGKTTASAYGIVDKLTMSHTGNQLTNVADAGTTVSLAESNDFKKGSTTNPGYAYNKNGAMTKDLNKKISSISYNSLSLPKSLVINGVTHTYTYSADRTKLRVVQGSTNRDYAGSIIYENGSLKRILVDGGYIEGGVYYFNLNDHLGNTRVVANASGTAIQRDHYYPFGLPMAETTNADQNKQPYKYNGKEFERKDGLNWMDYGARHYDAALGRFTTMDPLAEKKPWLTPYHYCSNNPICRIDSDGKDDYRFLSNGSISIVQGTRGNKKPHRLLGQFGSEITVKNDKILSDLAKNRGGNVGPRIHYHTTSDIEDAVKVYKFASDNTSIEWKLEIYNEEGNTTATVVTNLDPGRVQGTDKVNDGKEMTIRIHTHPDGGDTTETSKADKDGAELRPKSKHAIYHPHSNKLYEFNKNGIYNSIPAKEYDDILKYINNNVR